MDISKLGFKELLFLYMNVKGYKKNTVCKKGTDIPDYFGLDSIKKSAGKSVRGKEFTQEWTNRWVDALNTYYSFGENKFDSYRKKVFLNFENKNHESISDFLNRVYELIKRLIIKQSTDEISREMVIASFGFRGSVDVSANLLASDMHSSRVNPKYLRHVIKLLVLTDLNEQLNLNFRELQAQGTVRDTQFRINLRYIFDNYLDNLEKINPYLADQLRMNRDAILNKNVKDPKRGEDTFLNRMTFYIENIVGKSELNKQTIALYREKLDFVLTNEQRRNKKKRSNRVKDFAVLNRPEHCAACHNKYKTEDRTFKYRNRNIWYFELHHVISYANENIETENPDNYVKLCPACHRALTPNRAEESYQKELITNILEDPDTLYFVEGVKEYSKSSKTPVDFVYSLLK